MAEFISVPIQTVAENQNVLFSNAGTKCCKLITHRDGSGLVGIRGFADAYKTRFKVLFTANIALPTGGTVAPISVALAVNGEPLGYTTSIVTPTAVEEFGNVTVASEIEADCDCCLTLAIENTSGAPIEIQNANLIVSIK